MARVRAHTRTVGGRRQQVRAHSRLQPKRARRNARRAYRLTRRNRWGPAAAAAGIAAAEISGWLLLRGTGVALTTLGIVAVAAGVAAIRQSSPPPPSRGGRATTFGDLQRHRARQAEEQQRAQRPR